jgi:hypothetical protein
MTKDEAQSSIRTFYVAVGNEKTPVTTKPLTGAILLIEWTRI